MVANRESWEVYPEGNRIEHIKSLPNFQDHRDHVTNFLDCMKSRKMNTACTIDNGSLCAKYAHLGNISLLLPKVINPEHSIIQWPIN